MFFYHLKFTFLPMYPSPVSGRNPKTFILVRTTLNMRAVVTFQPNRFTNFFTHHGSSVIKLFFDRGACTSKMAI